jgi:hypothetical protein
MLKKHTKLRTKVKLGYLNERETELKYEACSDETSSGIALSKGIEDGQ